MEFFSLTNETVLMFGQIVLALFLGILLGAERSFAGKTAGMRTYGLVAMGSCLLIIISQVGTASFIGVSTFDPMRIAAGIIMGIGFIAGGIIIYNERDSSVSGLTTAAGIWVASGIGIAVGFGLSTIAILTTLLTIFTFSILWRIEEKFKNFLNKNI